MVVVVLATLFFSFYAIAIAAAEETPAVKVDRLTRVVEGRSISFELKAMPEKYQGEGRIPLELFTVSPDSNFWCGPNRPHPYSWLTTNVFCRQHIDFQILFCTAEGDSIEVLDFEGVEPAAYRVEVGDINRPQPGLYMLKFRYQGTVVEEFLVHILDSK
jgi:hypothetical protein